MSLAARLEELAELQKKDPSNIHIENRVKELLDAELLEGKSSELIHELEKGIAKCIGLNEEDAEVLDEQLTQETEIYSFFDSEIRAFFGLKSQ